MWKYCQITLIYFLLLIYHKYPAIDCSPITPRSLPDHHRWDLLALRYHEMMVIYPYPFLLVINQLFSCIIFINDGICILTGSPG